MKPTKVLAKEIDYFCVSYIDKGFSGCSLVVKLQPSKLATRVRFPSPAPYLRSVAQLVEHRSPKPGAVGSSPSTPANNNMIINKIFVYQIDIMTSN